MSPAFTVVIDLGLGEGHTTRRCRRVTYPELYITKYTTYTKIRPVVSPNAAFEKPRASPNTVL